MKRRDSGDRGAIAVEAALILPVLVLLFLGIVDVTLLFRDHISATSLTRSGARVASAEPRFGTDTADWGHSGTGNTSSFAQDAAVALQRAGSALPGKTIDYVWVYLANKQGFPSATVDGWKADTTSDFSSCPEETCVAYVWDNGTPGKFKWLSGKWDPRSIDSCVGDPNGQSVGVHLKATHAWLFGLFGSPDTKVNAQTVMKFEPRTVFDNQNQPPSDGSRPGFFEGCRKL